MPSDKIKQLYDDYARTRNPGDLLGQVRRTVNGEPVDDAQIGMIVSAVASYLCLQPDDYVLDLCCGNGLLSDRFFALSRGGVGVDMGEYLISIARSTFGDSAERRYVVADVVGFVREEPSPERFTKAVCYGSFAYLSDDEATAMLAALRTRFTALEAFVIGNIPDRAKARAFFRPESYVEGVELDHETVIGRWRTRDEIERLASVSGWSVAFAVMPDEYYGHAYRFDAILRPAPLAR